jgi:hypothetical protein
MRAWLAVDEDSILLLNGGAANTLDMSTSFANAKTVRSLLEQASKRGGTLSIIPLAYFCSQHRNYYRNENASPAGLAKSLLLQLIEQYPGFSSDDLQNCLDHAERSNIQSICSCFGHLIKKLPSSVVIFLIVDGISFFSTPPKQAEEMGETFGYLMDLYRQKKEATLKILLTSPTRSRYLEDLFEDEDILTLPTIPPPNDGHSLLQL